MDVLPPCVAEIEHGLLGGLEVMARDDLAGCDGGDVGSAPVDAGDGAGVEVEAARGADSSVVLPGSERSRLPTLLGHSAGEMQHSQCQPACRALHARDRADLRHLALRECQLRGRVVRIMCELGAGLAEILEPEPQAAVLLLKPT